MQGIGTAKARRHRRVFLGATLGALVVATAAPAQDELALGEASGELTGAVITAEAQAAATDLASRLRSIEGSLRSAGPILDGPQGLTAEENHRLTEAAAKEELSGLAGDLDLLSGALAAEGTQEIAGALLENVARRKARLLVLAGLTHQPLIPAEELELLAERWQDLDRLSAELRRGAAEALDSAP